MPYFGIPIRNGLPIGLGSVAGFGIAPFSPESLFENGEQGAWYDPSDFTTLFTDAAGTDPITAIGAGSPKFVGLMLDKSKGLVLGPELVTNGSGSNTTGWDVGAGLSSLTSVNGEFVATANGGLSSFFSRLVTLEVGKWYQCSVTVRSPSSNSVTNLGRLRVEGGITANLAVQVSQEDANVTLSGYVLATSTSTRIYVSVQTAAVWGGSGDVLYASNVSIKSVAGNHATSSGTNRPELSARYNLLTYTEQFDNPAWLKFGVTISPNAGTAPDGTTTADLIYPSSTGSDRAIYRGGFSLISKTHSVAAKAAGKSWFCIYQEDTTGGAAWFDLANGTVGTVAAGFANATIAPLGNGWYRCSVTSTSGFSQYTAFAPVDADNSNTLTVNGTDGALIWGADLRPASQATGLIGPTYQRVADANTYDTAGFLPYLKFDGLSWSMITNSIDFSAGDKMTVWAGVRKLSDAAAGTVTELSANTNTNTGSFALFAPSSAAANYFWRSYGTGLADVTVTPYAAPITNLLTGQGAISNDISTLRVNGTQVGSSVADQGTGNYGNYPLFIGGRNNASLFFNGWMYSLTVRGAQSSASQISSMESWVAGKTGVSL